MIDNTIRSSLLAALESWDQSAAKERAGRAKDVRQEFVARFPISAWPTMPLDDYALGQRSQQTVSWWLEYNSSVVGSIKGGSARKHLIFRAKNGTWTFPPEYDSVDAAWVAIRDGFTQMLTLAGQGQFGDADDIRVLTGAQAVRTKLLYMYFPNDLVPVSSKHDIDHYLHSLGEKQPAPTPVRANRQLLATLRSCDDLSSLSNQELGIFLYHWNSPRSSSRIVKIAPGELGKFWTDCYAENYICVGWDEVGDLAHFEDKETFRNAFREHFPYNGVEQQVSRKANELWTLRELQPGDTVVANRGTTELLGIGTVNDVGYLWRPERDSYRHTVGVDWDTSKAGQIPPVKAWATTTVSKVSAALARQLLGAGPAPKPVDADRQYLEIESALERKGQVILYGPPGTGKTFLANRAAVWLLEGGSPSANANAMLGDEASLASRSKSLSTPPGRGVGAARLTRITFHPSYAYEDFIEGFRPEQSEAGSMQLILRDGAFKRVCDTAAADPKNKYVVLIDEINRGNIPKIFGELITLIEKDKRGLTTQLAQSGSNFAVPPNVAIIGTMNTADRSIHLLDTALRRRFQFVELLPNSELLAGTTVGALALDSFLDGLNDEVRNRFGRDKQIGHSMFFHDGEIIDTPEEFASMFRYELLPLLQEYLFEDYRGLAELLGSVIDVDDQTITDLADDPEALCAELAAKFGSASA